MRKVGRATYESIPFRFVASGLHPRLRKMTVEPVIRLKEVLAFRQVSLRGLCGGWGLMSGLLSAQSQAVACFDGRLNVGAVFARLDDEKEPSGTQVAREI